MTLLQKFKIKNVNNALIIGFLTVFVVGYSVFFASPYFMAGVGTLKFTELKEPVVLENRNIQILNWTYSSSQKRMEVEIQIDNQSFDGRDTYSFSAMFRPSNGKVEIQKILAEPNYVVLEIDNVPKNFQEISLRMEVETDPSEKIKLYSNIDKITQMEVIEPLSQLEYHLRRIERNISDYRSKIDSINNEIQALNNKIQNIESSNIRLEDSKQYQTSSEIADTNKQIKKNLDIVKNLKDEIDELQKSKRDQQNLIAQAEERLNELRK